MNEHGFSQGLGKRLRKEDVYVWKVNDNFAGGVPDFYFSKQGGDLWCEVKFVTLPKRGATVVRFGLSELQKIWLRERHAEGRNVCVVIGTPDGHVLFPGLDWDRDVYQSEFVTRRVDWPYLVRDILNRMEA